MEIRKPNGKMKTVLVTVGTTKFDKLVATVSDPTTLEKLATLGYTHVLIQRGDGNFVPQSPIQSIGIVLEHFTYKPSIKEDIQAADLVISHAGAGSVLETLGAGKPLLVVINEDLMGNHQLELAHQLYLDQHLFYCTCGELVDKLSSADFNSLKPFPAGKPQLLSQYLDNMLGFT